MVRRASGLILVGGALCVLAARPVQSIPAMHQVRMTSGRYEPAEIAVRAGDTVRFANARGGPHNIEFFADSIQVTDQRLLAQAMGGDKIGPLSSPLLIQDDAEYQIVVPALTPGRYAFVCRPHFAAGMKGGMTVSAGPSALTGTWRFIEAVDWDSAGRAVRYYGPRPCGYIIYTSTGQFSVHLGRCDPPEEFTSYFGAYQVDPAGRIVTHRVEGGTVREYLHTSQERPFRISGDSLILGDGKSWRRTLLRVH